MPGRSAATGPGRRRGRWCSGVRSDEGRRTRHFKKDVTLASLREALAARPVVLEGLAAVATVSDKADAEPLQAARA